ncbi:MAG TPA: hypothetical protein VNK26_03575 [Pyrinomonadaceae bacterium]|jgi:hypothetical protein|nr:hypothetical protein [Pyrinomonadaceae bacterium]
MATVSEKNYLAPTQLSRFRNAALGLGGIALLAWAFGTYFNPEQGLRSWLLGFIYWGGIAIGGLGILMLQYLTGGAWGVMLRRVVEAASRTLPLVFILWIPLAIGIGHLYEWTHLPPDDPTVIQRGAFQTPLWWIIRSIAYFVIFGIMAFLLNRWSAEQDAAKDYESAADRLGIATKFSGPAIVIFVLTVTFASVDWVLSLDPHWFSTIWGLLFVVGWALSTFSLVVLLLAWLSDRDPLKGVLGKRHFHDIGKLILAFVMVWAYFNFSQLIIVYSGNIPEETSWYLDRMSPGWFWVGMILVVFHFAFPFLFLLDQDWKKKAKTLAAICAFILVMRLVDMYFLIGPSPRVTTGGESLPLSASISWLDIVAPIAVGGIWLWYFLGQLANRPLVPVMDPFLPNAIEHGHGH